MQFDQLKRRDFTTLFGGAAVAKNGGAAMKRKERVSAISCGVALLLSAGLGHAMDIDAKSFRCITKMTPVRQFYVDNLQGNLDATLAAAN